MTRKRLRSLAPRQRIPQIPLPQQEGPIDGVVDALMRAWNEQAYDVDAHTFFGGCLFGERHAILDRSVNRYGEQDRTFVARWLIELARAINGASIRWGR